MPSCHQVLCAMLELEAVEGHDMKMQMITTLQSTCDGKRMYAQLCERQIAIKEIVSAAKLDVVIILIHVFFSDDFLCIYSSMGHDSVFEVFTDPHSLFCRVSPGSQISILCVANSGQSCRMCSGGYLLLHSCKWI